MSPPRIVSLVPSWTETLVAAGANVVGRTRYCVHPADQVADIPVVGGTKQVDWHAIAALRPDLLLLDEEENPRSFADTSPCPVLATTIRTAADVPPALRVFATNLQAPGLQQLADEWAAALRDVVDSAPAAPRVHDLPGMQRWLRPPTSATTHFVYLIWHNPWMTIGRDTFIASMLDLLGFANLRLDLANGRYPQLDVGDLDPQTVALVGATEPYPFAAQAHRLLALPHPCGLVDGEAYAWFGLRALRFLQATTAARRRQA